MPESKSSSSGSGVLTILLVIFVTLKLLAVDPVAQWSWWWVLSPFWLPLGVLRAREMQRVMEDDQP